MNKYEFITALQRKLTGEVPPEKVRELTDYYSDYIDMEIKKGRSEEEVLNSLGDPHLLAKSIVASEGGADGSVGDNNSRSYGRRSSSEYDPYNTEYYGYQSSNGSVHEVKKWELILFTIGLAVVLIAIIVLIFRIVGFALGIIFKYFLPVVVLAGIAYVIYIYLIKK